jgi:hypothetical protein
MQRAEPLAEQFVIAGTGPWWLVAAQDTQYALRIQANAFTQFPLLGFWFWVHRLCQGAAAALLQRPQAKAITSWLLYVYAFRLPHLVVSSGGAVHQCMLLALPWLIGTASSLTWV